MLPEYFKEVKYKTARSGGKGGQNVNKVETMVEAYWHIVDSVYFTNDEKVLLQNKLANKINLDGYLFLKSQTARTQLANKIDVQKKLQKIITAALVVAVKRKPTKIPKAIVAKRLETKKKTGEIKAGRKKITAHE
jgi:ribosome-associated protein